MKTRSKDPAAARSRNPKASPHRHAHTVFRARTFATVSRIRRGAGAVGFHRVDGSGAAARGFEPQRARPRKEVEDAHARHVAQEMPEPVEDRLTHAL